MSTSNKISTSAQNYADSLIKVGQDGIMTYDAILTDLNTIREITSSSQELIDVMDSPAISVNTKDEKLMKAALKDRLHQPYREKLVPGMKEIMEAFKHEDGVLGCVLSGAGPSLLIISHKYDLDKIKSVVKDIWEKQNIKADVRSMKVEEQGAVIF